ncbi:hypothetical protein EYF80_001112 [Liparis tanakae]|uniref:Uncharacterized protein n=1 Tax=Liparis tanakae TaxID=230148 RepID=A0A4Z2JF23_9TELE|nr:hypothetical protein EYF80_001112 [Liparis tanakae]
MAAAPPALAEWNEGLVLDPTNGLHLVGPSPLDPRHSIGPAALHTQQLSGPAERGTSTPPYSIRSGREKKRSSQPGEGTGLGHDSSLLPIRGLQDTPTDDDDIRASVVEDFLWGGVLLAQPIALASDPWELICAMSKQPRPRGFPTALRPFTTPGPGTAWALTMWDQEEIWYNPPGGRG